MRLAFFGTPTDAVPYLDALVDAGHDLALVVTRADRRRRRGGTDEPSPVKAAAIARGLPVRTPVRAGELAEEIRALAVDLVVVVAYGDLLPQPLLDVVPDRFVNVHYSLLPRWRGAAPVERAILAGDAETGVCLMRLEAGLDTGPVYARARVPITDTMTAGALRTELTARGVTLLCDELDQLPDRVPEAQIGDASYAAKLTTTEFHLDAAEPAVVAQRRVRAANPRPGAWIDIDDTRVKIWAAVLIDQAVPEGTLTGTGVLGTSAGSLRLLEVQPAGRARMPATAWLAGHRGPRVVA